MADEAVWAVWADDKVSLTMAILPEVRRLVFSPLNHNSRLTRNILLIQ